MLEHIEQTEEAQELWIDELYRPLPGVDPDKVSSDTVAEEMALFNSGRQNMSS